MADFKKVINEAHSDGCKTVGTEEMNKLISHAISLIEPELKKQFYYFKENKICVGDFLSYLMNVVGQVSCFFVANSIEASPNVETKEHVISLIKGLAIFHGITIVQHNFVENNSLH